MRKVRLFLLFSFFVLTSCTPATKKVAVKIIPCITKCLGEALVETIRPAGLTLSTQGPFCRYFSVKGKDGYTNIRVCPKQKAPSP